MPNEPFVALRDSEERYWFDDTLSPESAEIKWCGHHCAFGEGVTPGQGSVFWMPEHHVCFIVGKQVNQKVWRVCWTSDFPWDVPLVHPSPPPKSMGSGTAIILGLRSPAIATRMPNVPRKPVAWTPYAWDKTMGAYKCTVVHDYELDTWRWGICHQKFSEEFGLDFLVGDCYGCSDSRRSAFADADKWVQQHPLQVGDPEIPGA